MSQSDFRAIIILSQLKVMIIPFTRGKTIFSDGVFLRMIEHLLVLYHTTLYREDLDAIEKRLTHVFSVMLKHAPELDIQTILFFTIHFTMQQFKYMKNTDRISAWSELSKFAEKHLDESYQNMMTQNKYNSKKEFIQNFEKILDDKDNNQPQILRKQSL